MSTLDSAINPQEQTSQGKGWIVSLITHILVIIALFLPMIVNKTPPPEEEGLLVNLGLLDEGQGEETPKGTDNEVAPQPEQHLQSRLLRRVSPVPRKARLLQRKQPPGRQLKLMHSERQQKKPVARKHITKPKSHMVICWVEAEKETQENLAARETQMAILIQISWRESAKEAVESEGAWVIVACCMNH